MWLVRSRLTTSPASMTLAIGDGSQLRHGLAQRLDDALHVGVAHPDGGPHDRHLPELAHDDFRANVDSGRVAQRLPGRQHVGVDLGRSDDGQLVLVHRMVERFLHQLSQDLAAHLITEHPLDHAARRATGAESRQLGLAPDVLQRAIDLALDRWGVDLDQESLATRTQLFDRDLGGIHSTFT